MESVRAGLGGLTLDVLVNTAAMHHVEKCEQDPAEAYAVNAMGTRNLAIVTREVGSAIRSCQHRLCV